MEIDIIYSDNCEKNDYAIIEFQGEIEKDEA